MAGGQEGAPFVSVTEVMPTVVFNSDRLAHGGGMVHLPVSTAAVPTRNAVVVTTLCGMVGLGEVRSRRGATCGECLSLRVQMGLT